MSSKVRKEGKGPHKPKFPELPPKYSISRELRNKAEKMRRDRLNKYIEEMRTLVPIISNRSRKSDTTRTNILRLAANFLRLQNLFNNPKSSPPSPASFLQEGLSHLESMDGFLFMLLEDGRILYVSENVTKFIGYSQMEMMGWPIFNFTHSSDHDKLRSNLSRRKNKLPDKNLDDLSMSPSSSISPSPSASSSTSDSREEPKVYGIRQSFYIRLRERPMSKNDPCQYEHIHVVGHFKRSPSSLAKDERLKAKLGDNMIMDDGEYVFVGIMRSVRDRPITELSLMEAIQDQYITRHLPDGRIVYSDHRIATIAGYLPSEVQGKSAFNFIYGEDLPWTTMAQRHMFASSNGEGDTTYRLLARSGQLICLQSRGFLEFNKVTNKVESFMCINTLIRPEDIERCLAEQKERFTPYITEFQLNSINADKDSSMAMIPNLTETRCRLSSPSLSVSKCSPSSQPRRIKTPPFSPRPKLDLVKMETEDPDEKDNQRPSSIGKRKSSPGYESLEKSAKFSRLSPGRQIYQTPPTCRGQLQYPRSPQNPLDKSPLSPRGEQYLAREEPAHRLEGGNRIVDVSFTEHSAYSSTGLNSSAMDKSLSLTSIDKQNLESKTLRTFNNMADVNGWTHHEQISKEELESNCNSLSIDTATDQSNVEADGRSNTLSHRRVESVIKSSSNQISVEDVKKKILLDLIREKTPTGSSGSSGYSDYSVDITSPGFHVDNNTLGYNVDKIALGYNVDNNTAGYNVDKTTLGYNMDNNPIGYNVESNTTGYQMHHLHMDKYQHEKTDRLSRSDPTYQLNEPRKTLPNIDVSVDDFNVVKTITHNKSFLR